MTDQTVILHDGVRERYNEVLDKLKATQVAADDVAFASDTQMAEALLYRRQVAQQLTESFFVTWMQLTVRGGNPDHDGPLHIYPDLDQELSFGFRYETSGYQGALLFWPKDEQPMKDSGPVIPAGRWQTHT